MMVEDTRCVDTGAVGEVSALVEVETHERVAGGEDGEEHRLIGLGAGVRLHVGELSSEEFLHTVDGELLYLVDDLAAAIVTFAGQTLGIFVGEVTAHGCHDLVGDEVLTGDEFHAPELALMLLLDEVENLSVFLHSLFMV